MTEILGVRHVGLPATNLPALAAFYRDVMGMTITRQNSPDAPYGASVFLASHPDEEDHDIVFFEDPALAHIALRVSSLNDLQTWYRRIRDSGIVIKYALNHGTEYSFYFDDPEGHTIEMYWSTDYRGPQPLAEPIDLNRSEEELLREAERTAARIGLLAVTSN